MNNEMELIFLKRTHHHQVLVKNNLLLMQGYLGLSYDLLLETANNHDMSKYDDPERAGYTWMTWNIHCKNRNIYFDCNKTIEAIIHQSHIHHITRNKHHPEAHHHPDQMSELDIIEMVCDWTAISQELSINNGSSLRWALENIDKKWRFSSKMKKFIFSVIHELDERNK